MTSTRLRVKEILKERRWTTKVLAEKTGMSESYLTHIKNSTRRWNEDALRKLSDAFEMDPIELFEQEGQADRDLINPAIPMGASDGSSKSGNAKIVPVVGEIPAQPSEFNNSMIQAETGYSGEFVPVIWNSKAALFCLHLRDSSHAPYFSKGDYLIVAPEEEVKSGDIVAVEYGNDNLVRTIASINYTGNIIVLEAMNGKGSPLALVKGKDHCRIIGKVIYRYQKLA